MSDAAAGETARRILADGTPLIDVRAPVEFAKGAPAAAVNLPILDNTERAAVGACYHAHGQEEARALGERLVAKDGRKERRIEGWTQHIQASERPVWIYCWRGGDRSQIAQEWLRNHASVDVQRVEGGFQALRRASLSAIEGAAASRAWLVISGRTGSGKTDLLQRFDTTIDLERRANHRGSSFGALPGGQPTPIRFELDLAADLLRLPAGPDVTLIEDEGFSVGNVPVPEPLVEVIRGAAVLQLEVAMEDRIRNVHRDYVSGPLRRGLPAFALGQTLLAATDRIRKRLGGDQHAVVRAEIEAAFASTAAVQSVETHAPWIRLLLTRYYDPLYDRGMSKQSERVVFRGDFEEACAWISKKASASVVAGSARGREVVDEAGDAP